MTRILPIVVAALLGHLAFAAAAPDPAAGPRATLLKFDKLLGPNEAEKALPLYHATNTRERAAAAVLAKIDGALANLRERAAAKYGPEVADAMVKSVGGTTAADIKAAQINVSGDRATIRYPGGNTPAVMVRVEGEWKLSVKDMLADFGVPPREFRHGIQRLTTSVNRVAGKIERSEYPDAESASKELLEAAKTAFAK
jgi:hypothetical protein